jgi:hypothetical protein
MSYNVDWDRVEDEIAALWTNALDRNGVTAALHRIDQALQRDPYACGESRSGTRRIVFDGPVSVLFRIVPPDRVIVVAVGSAGRRP